MNPKTYESLMKYRQEHLGRYDDVRARYPDRVLFFRIGDMYETYHDDAKICHKVLGLTLLTREQEGGELSLAGVPQEYIYGYVRKLLQAGHNVALIEPATDKQLSVTVLITADLGAVETVRSGGSAGAA